MAPAAGCLTLVPVPASGVCEHPHGPVNAFLWGLLPDNDVVIERGARHFQVSPKNPFALIGAVGEDCAGAVQFVRPNRLDALQGAPRIGSTGWSRTRSRKG